jgi:hypothetical protein
MQFVPTPALPRILFRKRSCLRLDDRWPFIVAKPRHLYTVASTVSEHNTIAQKERRSETGDAQ